MPDNGVTQRLAPSIRRLDATDADALVACFRRCYGDTYPSDDFYDPHRLAQRIESGSLRSVVAIAADGTLVGHTGLTVRHTDAKAIEAGNTVVDPAWRGHGLLARLGAALTELCTGEGYIAYLHYPTTAHAIMQTTSVKSGFETGVMLDYIPAETDYRAIERRDGRLAATVVYQPFSPAPQRTVFVPHAYRERIVHVYDAARLARTVSDPNDSIEPRDSEATVSFNARRGLVHVHVVRAGRDLRTLVEKHLQRSHATVAHVDLCMDEPGIDGAATALRKIGFVYCALLPEFARTDVLRLQRLARPSATSWVPALENPDARRLLGLMRAEFESLHNGEQ